VVENLRKILIYFKKWDSYWQLTQDDERLMIYPGKLGRYPLDFKPRIKEGHYPHFDEKGIPMWHNADNTGYVYHYTTMFSYALGKSDSYLLTGSDDDLRVFKSIADYIMDTVIRKGNELVLKESDAQGNHTGNLSAMTHGEAISVLCRTAEYTSDEKYLETAINLLSPFERSIDDNGVLGEITDIHLKWYEEYVTRPLNHVLNGMVYSIWGLRDLYLATGNSKAQELFLNGAGYIEKALPYFDSGYWSYYWIPESGRKYTASMMYHNLHICQLSALYNQTGIKSFEIYANKFRSYAKSPVCRFRAAMDITLTKTSGK
jgi:heparosan-N-sulfate-glucuronate 5-epimerase